MNSPVNTITNIIAGFSSVITLNDLRLNINLGVGEDERNVKQEVNISFKFFSKNMVKGCTTDDLKDTICYHEISEIIKKYSKESHFKLLEYLCFGLYKEVRQVIPSTMKIWVMVEKCNPPIENLTGTASFEYTDIWE